MWHEARKSEKKVHDMMEMARKRAMRRAVYLAKRRGDPHQSLQVSGSRCRFHRDDGLYQAAEDQLGLIPWNGFEDNLIDRFDGRALLDFIREPGRFSRAKEKTEEEEELEEFVNFERYRDLIKHRRRGFSEEEGLQHVQNELEAKITAQFSIAKPQQSQPPSTKGSYSQVGFSYNGQNAEETANPDTDDEDDEDEDDDEFSSDDSDDEKMEAIAKEFGVKRYNWLVYKEKKDKEEEQRQKELIKGDPSIKKLSRRERRRLSQMEREKEREQARSLGRAPHHDPYRDPRRSPSYDGYQRRRRSRSRSRSKSRSRSPLRRHSRDSPRSSRSSKPKIEYITEFGGGSPLRPDQRNSEWISPPSSPVQFDAVLNRSSGTVILEALHGDPASAARTIEQEKTAKFVKTPGSTSGLSKLNKTLTGGPSKNPAGEKKETPQERLKRIMSKQLNKQIKKDTAAELAKKREQERERRERLAELSRLSRRSRSRSWSRSRSRSRSRDRSRNRDRSRGRSRSSSRSPPRRRRYSRSHSRSRSPRRYRARSRSPTHRRTHTRSRTRSPSPRSRSRSRH